MVETIILMVASIGALLVGFELLSNNVTKLFHKGLKQLFYKTGKNDLVGVGIGTATTAIMQSSAATTIMVVGFVNTGVMSLKQAAAIIMGANIGTTITAQLAALNTFSFGAYAMGFAGIGVFISMFAKKDKTKTLGHALAGFGLLFFGLVSMSKAISGNEEIRSTIGNILSNINGPLAPVILFLLGIGFTALVQSSALITTIIITLAGTGIYIGSGGEMYLTDNVLYLILGTNIGTCITALISSVGASTNAKRASMIHLLFNGLGALLFALIFIVTELVSKTSFMELTFGKWFAGHPDTQIAMFHTVFNVTCTIIFLPFSKLLVKFSEKIVKDKPKKITSSVKLTYIDSRLLNTPSIAVHMVRKELSLMYAESLNVLNNSLEGFFNRDVDIKEEIDKQNQKLEDWNKLICEFMVKLTSQDLAYEDECTISAFHHTLNDILRIGEIGDNICKYTHQMVEEELQFSDNVILQIGFLRSTINNLYERTDEVFNTKDLNKLSVVDEIEDNVDKMRKELIDDHFDRLNRGECKPQNSAVFVNLINNLERAADHMTYIAHSVEEAYYQSQDLK